MSIFGTIMSKVFGSGAPSTPAPVAAAGAASASAADAPAPDAPADAPATTPAAVDVAALLDDMDDHGQDLDWRKSIVDLMKLLGLDSSLSARKQLAGELHYTGDTDDSASMNIWLHKQILAQFAANGGKLPADLY